MRIELLPSSLPPSDLQFLVSFLVNEAVAIDAGPLGLLADLDRQRRVSAFPAPRRRGPRSARDARP